MDTQKLESNVSLRRRRCQIDYYPAGVALRVQVPVVSSKNRGIRGEISEWSMASRRRLREFMLQHGAPDGWLTMGVTLTVPGPLLSVSDTRLLWERYTRLLAGTSLGLVWRMEVQERGAVHWHCQAIHPVHIQPDENGCYELPDGMLRRLWFKALDMMGHCVFEEHETNGRTIERQSGLRSSFIGAKEHCCDVQLNGDRGSWLRYMQDHLSKAKQEQIPKGFGRHWGVIGRKHFAKLQCGTTELPDKVYFRFLRAFKRLCTPMVKAPCVFGCRKGYAPSRGGRGTSVWFSRPETVKRLEQWAFSFEAIPQGAAPKG